MNNLLLNMNRKICNINLLRSSVNNVISRSTHSFIRVNKMCTPDHKRLIQQVKQTKGPLPFEPKLDRLINDFIDNLNHFQSQIQNLPKRNPRSVFVNGELR